jgi:hypothetical protein
MAACLGSDLALLAISTADVRKMLDNAVTPGTYL